MPDFFASRVPQILKGCNLSSILGTFSCKIGSPLNNCSSDLSDIISKLLSSSDPRPEPLFWTTFLTYHLEVYTAYLFKHLFGMSSTLDLTVYLASILTFPSGIYSDSLSGIFSSILFGIRFGSLSDILSGVCILAYVFWHIFWHFFWQSMCIFRFFFVVEVWRGSLWSRGCC